MLWTVTQSLLIGFGKTLEIFAMTLLFALPLGLIIAFGSMSRFRLIKTLSKTLVWVIRGTPLMLQLIVIFYGPGLIGSWAAEMHSDNALIQWLATWECFDRTTAVKYQGTDMNWFDNDPNAGGEPWANPASVTMQNYIYDVVKELGAMGVKDFIISGVQLPTGYSLEYRDFGVTNDQLQAQLQGFINTIQSRVAANGGDAYLAYDLTALNSGDVAKYIIAPQRYQASNVVLVGKNADFENGAADAVIAKFASDSAVEVLVLWNTEASLAENEKANGYFVK